MRGDPDSLATPMIILTAMAQQRDKFIGMASGADRYLLKPVKPIDLVEAVRAAIAMSNEERERMVQQRALELEDLS